MQHPPYPPLAAVYTELEEIARARDGWLDFTCASATLTRIRTNISREYFSFKIIAAMGRRKQALELERVWLRERKATALSLRNGFNILRRGFAKLD